MAPKPLTFIFFSIIIVFILFLTMYFFRSTTSDPISTTSIAYKSIVIDPGHGGVDTGTFYTNIYEKDINLSVSLKLKELLISGGYQVTLTRESDTALDKLNRTSVSRHRRDLNQRASVINEGNAELYISIHVNSQPGTRTNGAMIFYNKYFNEAKLLASHLQNNLNSISYNSYRPSPHKECSANYFILKNTKKPGVLIELGFMTNPTERNLLVTLEYQEYLANKIYEGIETYYSNRNLTLK